MLFPPLMSRAQGPGSQVGEICLRLGFQSKGTDWGVHVSLMTSPNFGFNSQTQNQSCLLFLSKSKRSIFLNLTFPEKVEIVDPKTTGQPQNETKTENQINDIEKEMEAKEPENKKEREEIGESNVFGGRSG